MKCEQELCPFWTGEGCACDVMDIATGECRGCGRTVAPTWESVDEYRESHMCPACLWGPLPIARRPYSADNTDSRGLA